MWVSLDFPLSDIAFFGTMPQRTLTGQLIPDDDFPWRCDLCGCGFWEKKGLSKHRKTCAGKRGTRRAVSAPADAAASSATSSHVAPAPAAASSASSSGARGRPLRRYDSLELNRARCSQGTRSAPLGMIVFSIKIINSHPGPEPLGL